MCELERDLGYGPFVQQITGIYYDLFFSYTIFLFQQLTGTFDELCGDRLVVDRALLRLELGSPSMSNLYHLWIRRNDTKRILFHVPHTFYQPFDGEAAGG